MLHFLDFVCLLYTSDAADDMQCVDLGGRRIIKKDGRSDIVGLPFWFFQAEDGIRDVERSRGLGDVYKRQQLVFFEYQLKNQLAYCLEISNLQSPLPVSYTHLTLPTICSV